MEDIVTVKRAINGDRQSFENLIDKYSDRLYREAYIRCKYEEDVKEIIQETIYKAYKNIHTLNDPKYFKRWISKILINECNDFLCKHGMIDLEHSKNSYIKEFIIGDMIDTKINLYNAIDELENKYKDVIILRYIERLKLEEISNILEITINEIKINLKKGILDMKKLLKEVDDIEQEKEQ
ncbi:sigma-70 family RNA polymerase sigma factor [Romboutsia lituseburensis]|uniref:sigma-70 family RNA polymerase sigma factor n=1 Tax=Romboutsia lituseburensis TaxID=1537 RepID=UPI00215AE715|nr:sigma-70 family RNA polymerase sigma factor [Romboutsia lituseburensis]MCR8744786.1 sigma-70 family RNA polymerase sigma factor [Romboutsia lituseburensis]